jgi:hypothetical protein
MEKMQPGTTDPIERAKARAASMYPKAQIRTKNAHGRPLVLVIERSLIRIVHLRDLDVKQAKRSRR